MRTFWIALAALLGALVIAAVLYPVFAPARMHHHRPRVQGLMKQLGTASHIYASDYDDRLPAAGIWCTLTEPYTKNKQIYNDPTIIRAPDAPPAKYGFAFYTLLGDAPLSWIEDAPSVPMIIQSERQAWNAHSGFSGLPLKPRIGGDKDCYAHADSSVKIRPRAWAETPPAIRLRKPKEKGDSKESPPPPPKK